MKPSPRFLLFVLLISCLMALPVSTVQAGSQSDALPNPAAEAYLLNALRTDGLADLESFPEGERNVSGAFLVSALKDPQVQSKSFLFIANMTVVDEVYANDSIIPGNIQFYRVEFAGYVDFNSSLTQALWIGESEFRDHVDLSFATLDGNIIMNKNTFESLSFRRSVINGSLDLRENTFKKGVDFYGVHVTSELLFDASRILGVKHPPEVSAPSEFWAITVDGPASFVNTHFAGKANFAQSDFFRLDMRDAIFDQDLDFTGTNVGRVANFTKAVFGQAANFKDFSVGSTANFAAATFKGTAVFENATIGRDAIFSGATFDGHANFDYITIGRFCDFIGTTFKDVFSFYYTSVAWPYFDGVTFKGPVSFEGMQASEDFEIANSSYDYLEKEFPITLVTVEGAVKFKDFSVPAGLELSRSHFESLSIDAQNKLETEFIDLSETDIANELTIANISMKRFTAEGATIGKSTNLCNVSITTELDMRNAHIGFLKIDRQPQWPTDPEAFNLRGMVYTDIDIGDQGLTEETLQALLGLVDTSAYSPQAYEALGQFLTDKGHSDWAAEVQLAQKRRERNESLAPFSGAWFWSWFMEIFAGYGQRPALAFIWSGLVVAIGALIFRRKEDMLPVEQEDAKLEYNPIWYSFALFLPYIDLNIACKWEPNPERKWARNYKYIHMMLGWILAPIALLTFGGIIG
ncbi:MAG: hypothetical protein EHM40_04680 [Chloroflexi bacterium]|nr:MAG: hypothetical protein EHM40_04680 [Chloroflexota bacterium]